MQSIAVEERVLKPLSSLQDLFQGPVRLCQKRTDKLMDYTAAMQKLRQNKDANKKAAVSKVLTSLLHILTTSCPSVRGGPGPEQDHLRGAQLPAGGRDAGPAGAGHRDPGRVRDPAGDGQEAVRGELHQGAAGDHGGEA